LDEVVRATGGNFRKSVVLLTGMENRALLNRSETITAQHMNLKRVA
jgi:hypothetical protein